MIDEPPAIGILMNTATSDEQVADLLLGIEEEGVPCTVRRCDELDPLVLAHQAALGSRLGVGVGIGIGYAVLTTEKLPEQRPYTAHIINRDRGVDRIIGSNAARLVKRIPLRPAEIGRSQ